MSDREIENLAIALRNFAKERDWEQFHSPKNLACSLSIEANEVLEAFQWLTDKQSNELTSEKIEEISLELGDVFLYLIRLADRLNVDLVDAASKKLSINALKYPVALARGSSKKYTEF